MDKIIDKKSHETIYLVRLIFLQDYIHVKFFRKRYGKTPDGGRSAVGRVLYYLTPLISLFNRQYLTATAAPCNLRAGTIPIKNTCHV